MNKISFYFLICLLSASVSCSKYDDTAIWQAINKHTEDIAALKEKCNILNSDISALRQIVNVLQGADFITNCVPLSDGTGYTIVFKSGTSIVIKNGFDGKYADTPSIGIDKYTDGIYYWTLNGEWLTDKSGNKIKAEGCDGANGKDGVTPKLKIEDGNWFLSTDNGLTWSMIGVAKGEDGETLFKNVIQGADCITFVLSDGTELKVPYYSTTRVRELKVVDGIAQSSDWVENGGYLYVTFNIPDITQDVVEKGLINVYLIYSDQSGTILPAIRYLSYTNSDGTLCYYSRTIDYEYSVGSLRIYYNISDFYYGDDWPGDLSFRIVILG